MCLASCSTPAGMDGLSVVVKIFSAVFAAGAHSMPFSVSPQPPTPQTALPNPTPCNPPHQGNVTSTPSAAKASVFLRHSLRSYQGVNVASAASPLHHGRFFSIPTPPQENRKNQPPGNHYCRLWGSCKLVHPSWAGRYQPSSGFIITAPPTIGCSNCSTSFRPSRCSFPNSQQCFLITVAGNFQHRKSAALKGSICGYRACPRHQGKPCRRCDRMARLLSHRSALREIKKGREVDHGTGNTRRP